MTTALSARRPCAGRYRAGGVALLGGRPPPAAFLLLRSSLSRPAPVRRTAHGSETTSPWARVLNALSVGTGVLSLRKRTEPSANAKLAPPGWPLPKAQPRSSSVGKSPPDGTR